MKKMTKIKICGITNQADAEKACELGADALGFVFFEKSKRYVQAKDLHWIKQLPAFVQIVGLFVDANCDFIEKTCNDIPIDLLQFHGNESPDFCNQFNKRYIKAVPMQNLNKTQSVSYMKRYSHAAGFLLDNYGSKSIGGSGELFDLSEIPDQDKLNQELILAGGFTPENIKQIILKNKPFAVDVSSGVEQAPGRKSIDKMRKFIEQAKL